jgi:hypothetical protein
MVISDLASVIECDRVVDDPEIVSVQMRQTCFSLFEEQHIAGWILQPGVYIIFTVVVPGDGDNKLGFGFDICSFDARVDQQKCDDKQKNKTNQRIE